LNPFYKNLALWLVITLMMVMLYNLFSKQHLAETSISYTDFLAMVNDERVSDVVIQGQELFVTDSNRNRFKVYAPQDTDLIKILRDKGVVISAKPPSENPWYMSVLVSWFPMIVLIGVWIFFMRQMQAGGGKALSFGKSRARLMSDQSERVTFEDVAGIDEAMEELIEIVEFLRDPKKFTRLAEYPKGCCWWVPPAAAKLFWRGLSRGKPGCHFSASAVRILSRCLSGWVHPGSGICLSRAKRMRPVSFLLMKLMQSAATAAPDSVVDTTKENRP
jgi:cell division protease FtsH